MSNPFRSFLIIFFVVFNHCVSWGQTTSAYKDPATTYRLGTELFEKEKYGAAQECFAAVIQLVENPFSPIRVDAEYYDALCALELYNRDAAYKMERFASSHPTSSHINLLQFQFGRLSFRDRRYRKAIESFEQVNTGELNPEDHAEFNFKLGYCYYKTDDLDEAQGHFQKVPASGSKYSSPSAYYLAHLDYAKGNYPSALQRFEALSGDPNFKGIAPYYIVQIHFMQGEYEAVIQEAPPLIANATDKRAAELKKVLGESYFYSGNYSKALPFLEQYQTEPGTRPGRHDQYVLGYTYYVTGNYSEAARFFQKVTGPQDTLAQYAWYYLGSCYLEEDQKKFAANAFMQAYKLPFDQDIREDALFNHAQLAFELSYDPYNEAVKSLRAYLKAYPESSRNDEAYNFLFKISMATRNFKDAQEALENIQMKGVDYKQNFQKITFYRGIELFNQFDYDQAIKMFAKAMEYNEDKSITAESQFWLAESFYRTENYWGAKKHYLEFLSATGAKSLPVYNMANYNLGYVYFNRKEYNGSIYHFNAFIQGRGNEQTVMIADAYLRLGDSWFVSKGYDNAITHYDKAIALKEVDMDYALLQKSKSLGVLQRYPEQIATLNQLISAYPGSSMVSEAYYELGNTYLMTRDHENALINFKKVANDYPQSVFAIKSQLKSGLIYYNSGLNDLAIKTFKGVVEGYPGTPEAMEALASLKNLYVELGRANDYIAYTSNLSYATISASEKDSILYSSAENQYLDGHCDIAEGALKNYLEQFPKGAFVINANFFLAECLAKAEKYEEALKRYKAVLEGSKSEFTESALLKAADLSYDLSAYKASLDYFVKLEEVAEVKANIPESWYGQMKCKYLLNDYEGAILPAEKLLREEKISDEMKLEAMLITARSYFLTGDMLMAKSKFRDIVSYSQGEAGAEAQYTIARIEYDMEDLEAAEKDVFELINKYSPYDYWVASGFILLADIYYDQGNTFQAKQTLQSIIDNHEGEELRVKAARKLQAIHSDEEMVGEPESDSAEVMDLNGDLIELEEFKD
jgi:TolA-binding protein